MAEIALITGACLRISRRGAAAGGPRSGGWSHSFIIKAAGKTLYIDPYFAESTPARLRRAEHGRVEARGSGTRDTRPRRPSLSRIT